MSQGLKGLAVTTLVISLISPVASAANGLVVKYTLAQTATTSNSKGEADRLFQEGVQQYRLGKYPQALQTYEKVLEMRQQLGDKAGIGQTLNNIGQVYNGLIQQEKALEVLQQALTIRRKIKDRAGEGETLDNIGGVYLALFKEEEALKTLQQALEIRREVKDKAGEAVTLSRMGFTYVFLKQQDKGLKLLQQALTMHKELGDKFQEGLTLFRIGVAYNNIDDYPNALDWLNKALAVNREVGNRAWEGRSLQQIGSIYFNKKEYDNALKFFQQSLTLIQEAGIRYFEASLLTGLGDTYFKQEKYDKAIELYQKALPVAREVKDKSIESEILVSLGNSYNKVKNYERALEFYQQTLPLVRELKNKSQEGRILFLIGTFYNLQGKYEQAIAPLQLSLPIAREVKDKFLEAKILSQLAVVYFNRKQFEQAIEFYQQALALERQPLNNRPVQLDTLMQIMQLYGLSANEARVKKDYSRAISQANQTLNLVPEALNIAREIKNPSAEKEVLNIQSEAYSSIGAFYLNMKELAKAEEFIQQGLTIARQSGNLKAEKNALSYLAGVYIAQGYNIKVIEIGQRELEITRILKDPFFEVRALLGLASTYNVLGDYEKGIQLSQEALTKSEEIDIQKVPKNNQEYALGSKPDALGLLSLIYNNLGEYDKALEFAQKRLNLVQSLKNPKLEAEALIRLGDVYENIQQFQQAIEITQQALRIARSINNSDLEAQTLKQISSIYTGKGDYKQALDSAQQILVIAEKTKKSNLKIDVLNIQRQVYTNQGNYKKALELFQNALSIAKQNSDFGSEWITLTEIGSFYKTLGDEQKSTEYFQQSLTLAQKIQNPQFEGVSLFLLAYSYFGKDQPEKIIEYANRGLAILPKIKMIPIEITGNYVLSLGYGELNNEPKAMAAAQAGLELARKSKNPGFEKEVLTSIGGLQRKFGKKQEAIQTYNQALAIKTQTKAVGADSGIYAGLGRAYADLNQPQLAINYYKEAINRIEEVRSGIKLLTPELQASFLQSTFDFGKVKTSDIYRQLAVLLLKEGRVEESLQVRQLAGIQELREEMGQTTNIVLSETEKKIIAQYGSLIAFEQKLEGCRKSKCGEFKQLQTDQDEISNQYNTKLNKLAIGLRNRFAEDNKGFFDPELSGKIREIVESQPGTVFISPIVYDNSIWLIWASEGGVRKAWEIKNVSEEELRQAVEDFRNSLAKSFTPVNKVQEKGKKLYDWLIKPLEGELRKNKIQNLVFALDRQVRYVPMSALYDGEKYLVERYNISVVPSAALVDMKEKLPPGTQNISVLGLGLTNEFPGFPALTNVQTELDEIVRKSTTDKKGIFPGKEFFNQAFNFDTVRNNLRGNQILHIATHGEFVSGSADASYILLGTGTKLLIPEITNLRDLYYVHLVVLSACQTAVGKKGENGVEINSISSKFLSQGTKAVIASLWVVNDESTSLLMQNFYGNLAKSTTQKHITKAEALHQAQLSLLYSGKNPQQNENDLSHPYYWAPFILIGNGL